MRHVVLVWSVAPAGPRLRLCGGWTAGGPEAIPKVTN